MSENGLSFEGNDYCSIHDVYIRKLNSVLSKECKGVFPERPYHANASVKK